MKKTKSKEVEDSWKYLITHFNEDYVLNEMQIDEYVIGRNNKDSFCYLVERRLRPLGSILGATASKFGLYYGRTKNDNIDTYRSTKRFGKTPDEAFDNIKKEINKLIIISKRLNSYEEVPSMFNGMFKHKIIYLYNKNIMLPCFNENDMIHFAKKLKLKPEKTYEKLQLQLLDYKNKNKPSSFSNHDFVCELYSAYGRSISKEEINTNDVRDVELNRKLSSKKINIIDNGDSPQTKRKATTSNSGSKYYPRDPKQAMISLKRAENKCEYNKKHYCFERRKNGTRYTEVHHLIPLCYYDEFDVSLDVPANIVSLCSSCHNEIHYGKNADLIIKNYITKEKGV